MEKLKTVPDTNDHKHTNSLIGESSPYLLQHAHNPVNWYPWGETALKKAKAENKLLIVSIGYAACHWCHVMEAESFEDEEVAAYMNAHFVSIKVDREERPDVDQIYMDAVQTITGSGGWPLNCFALPDGRPFYGGTYFKKKNWLNLLQKITQEYQTDSASIVKYADQLLGGIVNNDLLPPDGENRDLRLVLQETVEKWKEIVDTIEGGIQRNIKFPLPNNYEFLLDYAIITEDKFLRDYVARSLNKMAFGGIYDQIGGGFARYSTDVFWRVPHFEKMLYDNAQLVSLYSKAYRYYKNPLYKRIVKQTLAFMQRELTGPGEIFYSSLDADSEGEEGKFYTWSQDELRSIKGLNPEFSMELYNVKNGFEWEGNKHVLIRTKTDEILAEKFDMDLSDVRAEIDRINSLLLKERSKRTRPGLDDKCLTSWNALMVSGYVAAYRAVEEKNYLERAVRNMEFLMKHQFSEKSGLLHNYKEGKSSIRGFLEDYSFTIKALIDLYQVTFEKSWLDKAVVLTERCKKDFYSSENEMFYFTSREEVLLVARKTEFSDNVIPSANSTMARNLEVLGLLLDNKQYREMARKMMKRVAPHISYYGPSYSNWLTLMLEQLYPFYEIAICGKNTQKEKKSMDKEYLPNSVFLGTENEENLPLLENKIVKGKTLIYVCVDKTCKLPVEDPAAALEQISYRY